MYRLLIDQDKSAYNALVSHPLQSWEWGEFRQKMGVKVLRYGAFSGAKLTAAFQLTSHPVPFTSYAVGYLPKGPLPDKEMIAALTQIGNKNNCIFIQLEPNILKSSAISFQLPDRLKPSARPLFTKYTFHLDLTKSEDELLKNMHPKTRYNLRVAQKHGVTIQEENTDEAFEKYLELTQETTRRQGFYAHSEEYHRQMWQYLKSNIAHLFVARYQGKISVTWIVFLFKDVLYYPYGASSSENKEVMASNLMMWETIRFGKKHGAKIFDLWGTPGPDPVPSDPYFGFHRFKMGYGPKLVEFIGSYDLLLKQPQYTLFTFADKIRWFLLKFKAKFVI